MLGTLELRGAAVARSTQRTELPNGVLIVEQDPAVAKDIAATLRKLGYRVAGRAASGHEAIQKTLELQPDLVLIDVQLRGDLEGIETARAIRDQGRFPIVFLSALSDADTLHRALETEPLGYLIKPLREAELRCSVEVALSRHRLESALREREAPLRGISVVDEATGLHNRRGFMILAEQQLKVARRSGQSLVLFFVDVAGLELEQGGVSRIRDAAAVLDQTFREPDVIARLTDNEFAVLAIGADEPAAGQVLSRLGKALGMANRQTGRSAPLEMSVGFAVWDAKRNETADGLIGRADAATYRERRLRAASQPVSRAPSPAARCG
jgi:diguanylate cyclase (GGDEF)-like protein